MKQLFYLCLAGLLILAAGCKKDEIDNILNYDGDNVTGPELSAGYHELGARFTPDMTGPFAGRQLISVQYFMGLKPQAAEIRIYGENAPNFPGTLLYSADITDEIRTLRWSEHTLSTPVDIAEEDLWITIGVTHAGLQQSLGCDAGQNYTGEGDWLFQPTVGQWETFANRTGDRINWNIRGVVSEE
ncbi:hypothetical protein [Flavilitoribacter nigricans]|uniref:Uncharacterized protein n=1 Tax=Flavilitoribacter nigricans (strain ATCC 23147 / DSM 23189 / NBRC 102662 / NCIMB 1420 / SS-2) TaxID=1122177 RepID=A0A2D0NFH8_FLAN2|nr:hypothetical protein [Flavilitoribacter nigricans]PHN07168.1 hypothetical protein CRP01_08050 [Flavilitoribacter nigricans DSM 23189 = NBRC 102662]